MSYKKLKICTFNVRNDNLIKDLAKEKIVDCYQSLFYTNEIQVLATQEMVKPTLDILKKKFPEYQYLGRGRYGKGRLKNSIRTLRKYNEHATVITKLLVIKEKTIALPWIPSNLKDFYHGVFTYQSVTPRVLTDVVLQIEKQQIRLLNTHLDCHMNNVRRRQLNYILKYIKGSNLPVILLGDFNSDLSNKLFIKFIEDLEKLGLKRVEYNHKTFRKSKKDTPIDHIFIPKEYKIENMEVISSEELEKYSDHYPLCVTIRI